MGYIPRTDAWCEHALTQVMSPHILLHLGVYSKRQATSYPLDVTTRKLRNTISPTYNMTQKCCAAGPQESRRPTQHALKINHILQLRISNIYAQATSTIFSIHSHMYFQQHLLYYPSYHGLNIYYSAPHIAGYQSSFPFVCILDRCLVTSCNR